MANHSQLDPRSHFLSYPAALALDRRQFIYRLGYGLGGVALTALLANDRARAGVLAAKPPMLPAKAKACIFLLMEGGPSHIDTFDPKPKLAELHMKEFTRESKFASAMASGKRYFVQSPFKFRKAGQAGMDICENFVHLAGCADDLCVYRGAQAESVNHPTALYHLNTGNQFGGDPAMGAWVTYGLGTVNENLPAFVVLPELNFPQGGSANWSNGYLPAQYQGTPFRPTGSPVLDLNPPAALTKRRLIRLAGAASWRGGWSSKACDLSRFIRAAGTRTIISKRRTVPAFDRWTSPLPDCSRTSNAAACWRARW